MTSETLAGALLRVSATSTGACRDCGGLKCPHRVVTASPGVKTYKPAASCASCGLGAQSERSDGHDSRGALVYCEDEKWFHRACGGWASESPARLPAQTLPEMFRFPERLLAE